jgi:hypothetical protein
LACGVVGDSMHTLLSWKMDSLDARLARMVTHFFLPLVVCPLSSGAATRMQRNDTAKLTFFGIVVCYTLLE